MKRNRLLEVTQLYLLCTYMSRSTLIAKFIAGEFSLSFFGNFPFQSGQIGICQIQPTVMRRKWKKHRVKEEMSIFLCFFNSYMWDLLMQLHYVSSFADRMCNDVIDFIKNCHSFFVCFPVFYFFFFLSYFFPSRGKYMQS